MASTLLEGFESWPRRSRRCRPSTVILDGEVAVFDEHLLSRRDFLRRPDPGAVVTPPIYIWFDCVHAGGRDLRHYPLGARREVLEALLDGQQLLFAARRLPAHGLDAWAEVERRGYEGLVAKDESSSRFHDEANPRLEGGTSPDFWLNLQSLYELRLAERRARKTIKA